MTAKETTSQQIFNELLQIIKDLGPLEEQKSRLYWLLEEELGISMASIIANSPITISNEKWMQLLGMVNALATGKPIQHILGKSYFYGREYHVNHEVLVPRPETEELVHLIIQENSHKYVSILDIGTGSGCIPITLKLELPSSKIYAIDVSKEALSVAQENARKLDAIVHFLQHDVFDDFSLKDRFTIIVSNPPYIPEAEKEGMQTEVLHDPHLSLFVPDKSPFIFYKRIADLGKLLLESNGKLYFEIHSRFGKEICDLLNHKGYKNIRLIKDLNNKDRIVTAEI